MNFLILSKKRKKKRKTIHDYDYTAPILTSFFDQPTVNSGTISENNNEGIDPYLIENNAQQFQWSPNVHHEL